MKYKISVIVPIYNVEHNFLEECFNSIEKQTFRNFEVIIVNDGSTNPGIDLFLNQKFCNKKNYKIISYTKNRGLGPARNVGLKYSSGQIVTFVDSDDTILKDALESIVEQFNKNIGLQVAFFLSNRIDQNGIISRDGTETLSLSPTNILESPWLLQHKISSWAKGYDRNFIIKNKIFFLDKKIFQEDLYYFYNTISKAKSIVVIPKIIYTLRYRSGSLTQIEYNIKKAWDVLYNLEQVYYATREDGTIFSRKYYDIFNSAMAAYVWKNVHNININTNKEWKEFFDYSEKMKTLIRNNEKGELYE